MAVNRASLDAAMPHRLAAAHRIVEDAAQMALAAFNSRTGLALRSKAPQDFVSEVDELVERLIRQRIEIAFPGEPIVGEEYGGGFDATDADGGWILDPIDGTANFLRGVPLWGVSLGHVRAEQAGVGVVAMPALGLLVGAQRGAGLFVDGRPARREAAFGEVRVASLGDATDDLDEVCRYQRLLRGAGWVVEAWRSTSVAMSFAALGRLDGHVQPRVKPWDMAAGLALCAEAGLEVVHGPLDRTDNHVAVGTPAFMRALREGSLLAAA
jgi:myo-inositol-1(or 4)-monophosphatase